MATPFIRSDRNRHLAVVLLVYIGSSVMLWATKLTSSDYASVLSWTVGAYIAGGVGTHFAMKPRGDGGHQDADSPVRGT